MFFSPQNNNSLTTLLKAAKADFQFDQSGLKNRLQTSIRETHFYESDFQVSSGQSWQFKAGLAVSFGIVLMFVGTSVYANSSRPGDKLFWLDQLQENIALKVPRTAQSKAVLKSQIVIERLKEADNLTETSKKAESVKLKATADAQTSLIQTMEETAQIKQRLQAKGNQKSIMKVNNVLTNLGKLAETQERQIEKMRDESNDETERTQIQIRLDAIKKARLQASMESDDSDNSTEKSDD